jgi:hypothetical protein
MMRRVWVPKLRAAEAIEFAERFLHAHSSCNNLPTDWGFSVGIGLRRLSGAFVFVLTETLSNPIQQRGH